MSTYVGCKESAPVAGNGGNGLDNFGFPVIVEITHNLTANARKPFLFVIITAVSTCCQLG